jgi:hypothetical protein
MTHYTSIVLALTVRLVSDHHSPPSDDLHLHVRLPSELLSHSPKHWLASKLVKTNSKHQRSRPPRLGEGLPQRPKRKESDGRGKA